MIMQIVQEEQILKITDSIKGTSRLTIPAFLFCMTKLICALEVQLNILLLKLEETDNAQIVIT